MATSWSVASTIFFSCILLHETVSSSGASLDCSYGSSQVKILSSWVVSEQQNVYLFLKPFQSRRSCRARRLAGEFVNGVVVPNLRLNVTGVVVTANERQLGALRCTLESVQAELAAAGLGRSVKVSPELSLPSLRAMAKSRRRRGEKNWRRVMEFVRRSGSFVVVEMGAEEKADLAVADVAAAFEEGVGVAFRLSGRAAEMARLIGDADKGRRWMGVLAEVSSPSPRRELAAAARTTARDVFAPVTNPTTTPATNPVTVPATNPAMNPVTPGIVTVPSTNPATGYSNNPNLPPLYPEPTPVTMPDPTTTTPMTPTPFMNPVTAPTMPSPVTNPATTPAVTNPTTMPYPYQYPPQQGGGMPTYQPPATTMPPAAGGQTWCVAKAGLMDAALQSGLDYACGMGGADCTAIQPMGACYNPNTLQAHASYAFNSYFQRNPSPASCDFGGAGMLVNINPSSGTCLFQASSAGYGAGYNPGVTGTVPVGGGAGAGAGVGVGVTPMGPAVGGTGGAGVTPMGPAVGGGSGSTVLNANSPGGNSMYGSDSNPTSLTGGAAAAQSSGWVLCLVWIFTFAYVKEKV